jgi:basic amino acid/polyamine antiporter, APA family
MMSDVSGTGHIGLLHELGLRDGTAIVVGTIIGSGIFLVPNAIANETSGFFQIATVWIIGGLLSLCGALALGELGAAFPHAGGLYVYLREAYGRPVGFLYGWGLLTLIQTGSIATLAVAFRIYLGQIVNLTSTQEEIAGIACVLLLTIVNFFGLRSGKSVQNLFTIAKLGGLLSMIALLLGRGHAHLLATNFWPAPNAKFHSASLGIALIAVLWAYEGWHVVSFTAGEFKHPQRDLPLGLFYGTLIVAVVYLLANFGYYSVLEPAQIMQTSRVAAAAVTSVSGSAAAFFITVLILVSIVGATNGMTFTGPRVYYAMATEGLFFRRFGDIHSRFHVPIFGILIQGVWAASLTLLGTFQELFTYVIFTAWIFYGLAVGAVIVLRIRRPDIARPFRMPLYPWLAVVFVVAAFGVALSAIVSAPLHALYGIALILMGFPIYGLFVVRKQIPDAPSPRGDGAD